VRALLDRHGDNPQAVSEAIATFGLFGRTSDLSVAVEKGRQLLAEREKQITRGRSRRVVYGDDVETSASDIELTPRLQATSEAWRRLVEHRPAISEERRASCWSVVQEDVFVTCEAPVSEQ
jgi:hypothetical protein